MHNNTYKSVSSPTRTVCFDMEHLTAVRTISRSASPIACDVCIPAMFNLCDNKLIKACLLLRFIRNVFFFPRNFVDSINLTSVPSFLVSRFFCHVHCPWYWAHLHTHQIQQMHWWTSTQQILCMIHTIHQKFDHIPMVFTVITFHHQWHGTFFIGKCVM